MKKDKKSQFSKPLRVIVFFSGGASSLKYLLKNNENLGKKYQIVGAFTNNKNASAISFIKQAGIPVECLDFRDWRHKRNKEFNDMKARREYFEEIVNLIKPFKTDIIMLSGFMLLVKDPLLTDYKNRILNVHPADLTILNEKGERKYTGMDAVTDAIKAGEKYTKSTIHLVTEEVDGGRILTLSDRLSVDPGISPEVHQERMKWECDGPAYAEALTFIADGKIVIG